MSNAGSRDAIPDVGSSLDDFITAYVAAWNFHDAGRLLAFFHPDATYEDSVWPVTMHGHGDIQKLLTAAWRAFPDMHFELVEGPYRLGQSKAALWWRASGTMTGPLDPPGYAATGRSWEFDGVDFMEYRDGRIITLRVIFDMADAARQAGLIPQLGSRLGKITVRAQRLSVKVLPGSPAANPAAGILPEKANQQATPAVHRFVRRLAATEI
jgi:steroid delta-isomerase-like uncharacterized protein